MKLDWAILSNSAEIQANLSYVLGGGWDTGWRPIFPTPFLGALTLRLLVHPAEVSQPHKIELYFWNEDGKAFAPPLTITLGPSVVPPEHPRGWDLPAMLAIGLQNLQIPDQGRYSIELLVDGQHTKSIPFRFVSGGPPGAPLSPLPPQAPPQLPPPTTP